MARTPEAHHLSGLMYLLHAAAHQIKRSGIKNVVQFTTSCLTRTRLMQHIALPVVPDADAL